MDFSSGDYKDPKVASKKHAGVSNKEDEASRGRSPWALNQSSFPIFLGGFGLTVDADGPVGVDLRGDERLQVSHPLCIVM
jgi:hypothetical protein